MEIVCERQYGQPKLKKPTFLKPANLLGSVKFGKASCKIWKVGDDYYLLHRDWFSDMMPFVEAVKCGLIKERPKRFLYNDSWGVVVFRNEALLKFTREDWQTPGISSSTNIVMKLSKMLGLGETGLCGHSWEYLFEQCIKLAGYDECDTSVLSGDYAMLKPLI